MKKTLPPTYLFGAIILTTALHFLIPGYQLLVFPWRFLGFLPISTGVVLNLMADQTLKKHLTTVKPFEGSNTLITNGVYSLTRNPMYLGMTLIVLGIVLLLGSASPFVVAIAMPILFERVFILHEEKILEDTFGDRFREYRRQVRKWI